MSAAATPAAATSEASDPAAAAGGGPVLLGLAAAGLLAPVGLAAWAYAALSAPASSPGPAPTPVAAVEERPAAPAVAAADLAAALAADGMVKLPGGPFVRGTDDPPRLHGDESPARTLTLSPFWMDRHEVTNAEFARFVGATGYVTTAERPITRDDLAGQVPAAVLATIPDEGLPPGSVCFNEGFDRRVAAGIPENPNLVVAAGVWNIEPGADWRHPTGPGSDIAEKMDHPVVHVSHDDAVAYCRWAGKNLPTEAQWEYAARSGGEAGSDAPPGREHPWGDAKTPGGEHRGNIYQGRFPYEDSGADGFTGTAPVGSFAPNPLGLHDLGGNVWEWCRDWYRPDYYESCPAADPPGPTSSFDPNEPHLPKRVQRGGSFLCSDTYCTGYRSASRMKGDPATGSFHCGFRCVVEDPAAWASAPARTAK